MTAAPQNHNTTITKGHPNNATPFIVRSHPPQDPFHCKLPLCVRPFHHYPHKILTGVRHAGKSSCVAALEMAQEFFIIIEIRGVISAQVPVIRVMLVYIVCR